MLCQFIFKNFKSYRDETVFDMQAASIAEHSDSLLSYERDKKTFLPLSVIYGPNGGGKSGVLEALNSLVSLVMIPFKDWASDDKSRNFSSAPFTMRYSKCPPFAFNESSLKAPTEFIIFFRHKDFEFRYTLSVYYGVVVSESLYKKNIGAKNSAKIFERDSSGVQLGASFNKKTINTSEINSQIPYLSFLAINYNFEIINLAIEWFTKPIFINYSNPNMYKNIKKRLEKSLTLIPTLKEELVKTMQDMDIPISDFDIKYKIEENSNKSIDEVYITRELDGQEYKLNIFEESMGTFKLIGLLPVVLISLAEGRLLIVDEMDASLHPKLLRYIVKLYKNSTVNRNNAQLIFTSHDVTTMKNDLFRRDEIWFAARDEEGASEIYSLYEIRNTDGSHVKSTAPFDKQYIEGRYGADPYLSEMFSLKWEE